MKAGQASKTAVLVGIGRALADIAAPEARFSDPTAYALLPAAARERVDRVRSGSAPNGLRERFERAFLLQFSCVTAVRSVTIDEAIRSAHAPQVVILGAGLDGRAWRMRELADVAVFEVDHPDSQASKREHVGSLERAAAAVHFVEVDFTRDDLDRALSRGGHDPSRPTTWIWEGVVMYLDERDIERTLDVVARRSAAGSHLVVLYHTRTMMLPIIGAVVRRLGEPLRSSFTPETFRALTRRFGFEVRSDRSMATLGQAISPSMAKRTRRMGHLHVAVAVK